MFSDSHIHTKFSGDSQTEPEQVIKQAIKFGMDCITITDHQDFDFPDKSICFDIDIDKYFDELKELQYKYSNSINVLIGVETGLEPFLHEKIKKFVESKPFDFVIGSSHLVNRKDPYYKEFFEGKTDIECFDEYFESILQNLEINSDFDVYGHIDYIVRYAPDTNKNYHYENHADVLENILIKLISMDKGIEINTSGLAKGLGSPHPCVDIVKKYRQLGGEIITVGSDAHTSDFIGSYFKEAMNILLECGFKHYNIFKERKPEFIDIK